MTAKAADLDARSQGALGLRAHRLVDVADRGARRALCHAC